MPKTKRIEYLDEKNRPCFKFEGMHRAQIESPYQLDYAIHSASESPPKKVILLLHGFGNDANFMMQRFMPSLEKTKDFEQTCIIAPNGPFPMAQRKKINGVEKNQIGFAWYLYDHIDQQYFITQDIPVSIIMRLLEGLNLKDLPTQVIGYSQGGYLAPFLGLAHSRIEQVIGIASCFKYQYLPQKMDFQLDAVHGEQDDIVNFQNAKDSHRILIEQKNSGVFKSVPEQHHRLSTPLVQEAVELLL